MSAGRRPWRPRDAHDSMSANPPRSNEGRTTGMDRRESELKCEPSSRAVQQHLAVQQTIQTDQDIDGRKKYRRSVTQRSKRSRS